jgi:hypothetical protein
MDDPKNLPAVPASGTALGEPKPEALYRAHHDEAKNLRSGRIFLKYSKGDWYCGKDAITFPDNEFYFVPAMDLFERGWQCWSGGRPIDEKFVPYGTPPILQSQLADHAPYASKSDGWTEALKFPLIIVPYGKNHTAWLNVEFATSSAGGKDMVYSLSKQFSEKIKGGEITDTKPYVLCRAGSEFYQHKDFGRVYKPTVEVVKALSQAEIAAMLGGAVTTHKPAENADQPVVSAAPAAPTDLDKPPRPAVVPAPEPEADLSEEEAEAELALAEAKAKLAKAKAAKAKAATQAALGAADPPFTPDPPKPAKVSRKKVSI